MYLLFMRANNLDLPMDLELKLFDITVLPILTYSSEIYAYSNIEIIKRVQTESRRKITRSRRSTLKYILFAELGRQPIQIDVKVPMLNYWSSILNGKQTKLAFQTYLYMYKFIHNYKWLNHIQSILNDCGMNYIWLQQFRNVLKNIAKMVKSRLLDQFLQAWNVDLQLSAKGKHYALYKTNLNPESYLTKLHGAHLIDMLKFRACNH